MAATSGRILGLSLCTGTTTEISGDSVPCRSWVWNLVSMFMGSFIRRIKAYLWPKFAEDKVFRAMPGRLAEKPVIARAHVIVPLLCHGIHGISSAPVPDGRA